MYGGQVKAGTLFKPTSCSTTPIPMYLPVDANDMSIKYYFELPKEIVEQWEAIYEPTVEKTISVGGKFDVVLKNGKIFHKADDITDFVLKLLEYFKVVNTFDDYPVLIKEVTFSHTGCQEKITTLTDWQEVCTEWKKFNT